MVDTLLEDLEDRQGSWSYLKERIWRLKAPIDRQRDILDNCVNIIRF